MQTKIKIEKGIPLPTAKEKMPITQALEMMTKGDSFHVAKVEELRQARYQARKVNKKIVTKVLPDGFRIWVT